MADLKLLFVCGKNRWRSPTAEEIFYDYPGLEVDSAGIDRDAEVPIGAEAIEWADIIFVMEKKHLRKLRDKFKSTGCFRDQKIICLDIPDDYKYMQPELVILLQKKVLPLVGIENNAH